jgi:ATPase family associated with various cellular activities (AAA)
MRPHQRPRPCNSRQWTVPLLLLISESLALRLVAAWACERRILARPATKIINDPPRTRQYARHSCCRLLATQLPVVEDGLLTGLKSEPQHLPEHTETSVFDLIATRAACCLYESDIRRDAIGKGAGKQASSATNWIDEGTAFALKQSLDAMEWWSPAGVALDRNQVDELRSWRQWLLALPQPAVVDLSRDFRRVVSNTLLDSMLARIDQPRDEFLQRVACRLICLPSGMSLAHPLVEPSASIIFGKLLYGGVTRSRRLGNHREGGDDGPANFSVRRVAGVRTAVKATAKDQVPAWMIYGGPDRLYEAVDMGPAAVLEVYLLPPGKELSKGTSHQISGNMIIQGTSGNIQKLLVYRQREVDASLSNDKDGHFTTEYDNQGNRLASTLAGHDRNQAFRQDFASTVGGLGPQIEAIVRRVLDGRIIRPADDIDRERAAIEAARRTGLSSEDPTNHSVDSVAKDLMRTSLEADELALLGLTPVRGLLLYGPPGCGKTALAREISRALRARAPKITSAPELLDRWVGGSEKLVRSLFADAEAELAAVDGDATKSALHV